jgi:cell division protein ZipA
MSALRGILIVFAVLLLVTIYWWGRRADRKRRATAAAQLTQTAAESQPPAALPPPVTLESMAGDAFTRLEPTLHEPEYAGQVSDAGITGRSDTVADVPQADASGQPTTKIIALRLMATTPRFSGAHLRTALEGESLVFGKYQIFHRTTPEGDILFSVASMLEPGSFDLEQMFHEQYPGIVLFAQLPAVLDGMSVLGELIACARKLQQSLGGLLQDEQGTPLVAFRIEQLRREVREFEAAVARPRSEHP